MSPIDYLILNRADLMPVRQSKKMFSKVCARSNCYPNCIYFNSECYCRDCVGKTFLLNETIKTEIRL